MKSLSDFKIGCSNLATIMACFKKVGLTGPQLSELEKLQSKDGPLTERQEDRYELLLAKRDGDIAPTLSVKAQKYLIRRYSRFKYGKRYKIRNETELRFSGMLKGTLVETAAVKLLSEIDQMEYHRVKTSISNDFLYGYLDVLDAETVEKSSRVIEIKNIFDLTGFMLFAGKELPKSAWYQMQGYLAITGKEIGEVCYCLCDFPDFMIEEQRKIVMKAMCPDGIETDAFTKYWNIAERSMRFADIPAKERIISHPVHRCEETIDKIHEMVDFCRKWLLSWSAEYDIQSKKRYIEPKDNS